MIHNKFPHKIYQTNIEKPLDFHLETLNNAKSNLDINVTTNKNELFSSHGYSSLQKRYWVNSPTYGKEYKNPIPYGKAPFPETISPRLGISLQTPALNILYSIPRHFLKREIQPSFLGEARTLKGKWHIRPAEKNVFPMGIFYDD